MNKSKFRIKQITEPNSTSSYYVCEERHWLWGWGDMFVVGGYEGSGSWNQHFDTENEAKEEIKKELNRRKGRDVKIVWEGKL